ncbi:MAG: nitronate monooxygenase [Dehalococcoidia bacterium]|nr:nitronate monooxygenase [Dehalococcoidia bacterium]
MNLTEGITRRWSEDNLLKGRLMFKTRVTEMLGIKYPIICGGMNMLSRAELVAAVSNAGGLGLLASANFETAEQLRQEIRKTKSLTDKPFGCNINMFPSVRPIPNREFIEVICEEGVKAVETSGQRSPEEYVPHLKEGKVIIIHKAATLRHALKGQESGADMIAIVGTENGGATGPEDVSTLVLLPILADAAKVPVIAGGGFADGRGLVAALALGAEGIVMGTRFVATKECPAHPKFKEWMLKSTERDTVVIMRSLQNTHRVLRSKAVEDIQKLEARGARLEELLPLISGAAYRRVFLDGELDAGMNSVGEAVGLVSDVPTVKELIDRIVSQAEAIIGQRLPPMAGLSRR